jgi:PhzF family phenazine biosynthesis protein
VPKQAGVVRQECGVGIVDIDISQEILAFVAPPTTIEPISAEQLRRVVETLDIPIGAILHTAQLDNGPVWQVFQLADADDVLAVDSSRVRWPEFRSIGLIGAHPQGAECDYEVRMLAPSSGMSEDPVTGSLNAALAHWMKANGRLSRPITIAQGTTINRHGRVFVRPDDDGERILIGGETHILIEGSVTL